MSHKKLSARFYKTANAREPVRDWLLSLDVRDRKAIGMDIKTAEYGWPLGMPLCRAIKGHKGLWEIRCHLEGGRIARVFFCIYDSYLVLLHGFEKKSEKTPQKEIETAVKRMKEL
ncbi:type II toxin-antitoxin system RelE/ParE family toxin [Polycladidibacter stylochi]|uniref:type II toxin-antitoxin system RelE/ParE family toxin n=1 Tax=Polycladidibacter stylochi TaxID=1807766 RepID=UPI00082C13A3|nr:type II toxin-antitoxin system RelE/ParE family toxin [Pseudovibrio stylochi]